MAAPLMPAPDPAIAVAALETALATGMLTVEYNGRRVTYQSVEDLRAALAYFQGKIATADATAAGRVPGRSSYMEFRRD